MRSVDGDSCLYSPRTGWHGSVTIKGTLFESRIAMAALYNIDDVESDLA